VTDPAFSRRRVLFVDLLGFGISDRPADFAYSLRSHAESVARVLRHLGQGPVDVVGHSLSGSIAIHLASCTRNSSASCPTLPTTMLRSPALPL
jgi:pimeloyl-ACP methyl ester carboxylesterase